jgi:Na+/melibiose symporter-like transporter
MDSSSQFLFLFIWLIFITCLVDFLLSAWNTNYFSLLPDKFRSQEERTKIGGIGTILGILGITIGTLIPPLIIEYGNKESYFIAAGVIALIGILVTLLMIPGIREEEEMINRAFAQIEIMKTKSTSFWKELSFGLKKRNFVAFIIVNTAWQTVVVVTIASIPYLNQYIFKQPASSEIFITASLLIGSIGSVPFWVKFARKKGNRITVIIGMLLMAFSLLPLLFVTNIIGAAITTLFIGFGNGAIYIGIFPLLSDVIDEIVVDTKQRKEGIYIGIRTFFMRLSYISQAIIFVTVHVITGFNPVPGADQTQLALWGIRIHSALIPMIILTVGALIFWKICDLVPEKVDEIKLHMKELNI